MYVNGVEVRQITDLELNTSISCFMIGRECLGSNSYYGYIDDIRIWNRSLSAVT
jgi:hypothetical protein